MPRSTDLHGSAPDQHTDALLIIDLISDFEFPDGKSILRQALAIAPNLARLKTRAREAGIPAIYVNDNFGRWRSDFRALIEHCREGKARLLIEKLYPEQDDYFLLKPKHSGFFSSTLETLLRYLRVRRLIITGLAGNFCVLFTANDAYMRDYELAIPSDCVISNTAKENTEALQLMERYLKADTRHSQRISFGKRKRIQ